MEEEQNNKTEEQDVKGYTPDPNMMIKLNNKVLNL